MAKPLHYQIITRARAIITDERHWTPSYRARTNAKKLKLVSPDDPRARRFCATGAIRTRQDGGKVYSVGVRLIA